MGTITIKNGKLISPINGYYGECKDILIKYGKISLIDDNIQPEGTIIDAKNCIVTPGFIDIHTHCYPKAFLGMEPDIVGIQKGATTIIDAGSSGVDNYIDFKENYIDKSKTKVFTLINMSKEGLIKGHELDDISKIDIEKVIDTVNKYSDNIVGIKARASASVVGNMGLKPIEIAAETAHKIGKPLMIHVGNYPPALKDILNIVSKNDIITHAYHGKPGGIIDNNGNIIIEALEARKRGVKFDIGHGVASFSFRVFEKALKEDFDCDMISTDIHIENYNGPVYSLVDVASKVLNCGEEIYDVISKCTSVPANHFGLKGLGQIKEGMIGDINIMSIEKCNDTVEDSIGDTLDLSEKLVLIKTIYSRGNESEIFEHIIGKY